MFMIKLISQKPIILIDASYYVFYRYYATLRWFKFKQIDIDTEQLDPVFIDAFKKHFYNDISKLKKRFKISEDDIYLCMDCERCEIWRNDLFQDYKGNRQHAADFNKNIFEIFSNKINNTITEIRGTRLEADDVVALLKLRIHREYKDHRVVIITNDNDYLQLVDDNTLVLNMQMKDIQSRSYNGIKNELFIKALLGDKVDNIPKAMPKINKKLAIEISKLEPRDRLEWIKEHKGLKQFEKNMELISFNHIPIHLANDFLNTIDIKMI